MVEDFDTGYWDERIAVLEASLREMVDEFKAEVENSWGEVEDYDTVNGHAGQDEIDTGPGDDMLTTGADDGTIVQGRGADTGIDEAAG